jgi:hypothetical protein
MRFPWVELLAGAGAVVGAAPAGAQQVREIGIEAIATSSDPVLAVVGAYAGLRTSGRTRFSAALGAGVSDRELAWRAEALGHFLLSPDQRRGWGAYFAGGLAAVGGPVSRGYLVLAVGMEERPGARSGWAAEAGIGGGLRIALAYRWRRFPAGGNQQ